ncbi:MAG: prolyl oligopeptidase family serine peptidase [Phycisphaerales bacterium]
MVRIRSVAVFACVALGAAAPASAQDNTITLEKIMRDPEWVTRSPESPYWSLDSKTVYYSQKQLGTDLRDMFAVDYANDEEELLSPEQRAAADPRNVSYSRDRSRVTWSSGGDIFVRTMETGDIIQITRTGDNESSPMFLTNGKLAFRKGSTWFVRDLATGAEEQAGDVRTGEDPDIAREKRESREKSYLENQQEHLFEIIRERDESADQRREQMELLRNAETTRSYPTTWLGNGLDLGQSQLSPNGRWLAIVYSKSSGSRAKPDTMPTWINDDGYVQSRNVRSLVGTSESSNDMFALVHIETGTLIQVDLDALPGRTDDPLAEIRDSQKPADAKEDGTLDKEKKPSKPKPRNIGIRSVRFNDDGSWVALQCHSADNKDRWIVTIPFEHAFARLNDWNEGADDRKEKGDAKAQPDALTPIVIEHLHDPAWINDRMSEMEWVNGSERLLFVSERTGYAHLYVADATGKAQDPRRAVVVRQLTHGQCVVTDIQQDRDGRNVYFRVNRDHPGIYEIERLSLGWGKPTQITSLGGANRAWLSPDDSRLLIEHSTAMRPPELFVQETTPGADVIKVTTTVTDEFTSLPWIEPQFVTIQGVDTKPIHARLYLPPADAPRMDKRPAVLFTHGAGYLQNADQGWSSYFREFMFHSLLAHKGYVVLDMDYRASSGYGRDWRTAIYRHMGKPEVEDLSSGVDWLVEHHNVDRARVGTYGGSYGGFLTLYSMFTEPDLFACGAALRPVTDWAHYNHGYTSNILNTPDDDPEAYRLSSPIEYAEGLKNPLLICHGMVDDNVFFKDTARLAQRLIELEKTNWEVAIFPIEAHGFTEPSSWLNEYRRIEALFDRWLMGDN